MKKKCLNIIAVMSLFLTIDSPFAHSRERIDYENPNPNYWVNRTDTAGAHTYHKDGEYLALTIPKADSTHYYNSEIYDNPFSPFPNKNTIFNPFVVDDPYSAPQMYLTDLLLNIPYLYSDLTTEVRAEHLKGGSRGWGFWNTMGVMSSTQIAWFIQLDGKNSDGTPYPFNGFWAMTQNGGLPSMTKLPDLDENWHTYQIVWSKDSVQFYIDSNLVHTETKVVPDKHMAFHNWVDNSVFGLSMLSLVHILQDTQEDRSNYIKNLTFHLNAH